jgi:hypothetical protein
MVRGIAFAECQCVFVGNRTDIIRRMGNNVRSLHRNPLSTRECFHVVDVEWHIGRYRAQQINANCRTRDMGAAQARVVRIMRTQGPVYGDRQP